MRHSKPINNRSYGKPERDAATNQKNLAVKGEAAEYGGGREQYLCACVEKQHYAPAAFR